MTLYVINLVAAFGIFAACCMRLLQARHPVRANFGCIFSWFLWLAVHLGIGLPILVVGMQQAASGVTPAPLILVVKCSLAVLLLAPWRRRESER